VRSPLPHLPPHFVRLRKAEPADTASRPVAAKPARTDRSRWKRWLDPLAGHPPILRYWIYLAGGVLFYSAQAMVWAHIFGWTSMLDVLPIVAAVAFPIALLGLLADWCYTALKDILRRAGLE
jgi:hypothetical protein